MIVTAGATQRLTENNFADRIQQLIGYFHFLVFWVVAQQYLGANNNKARCNPLTVALVNRVVGQQVTCDLFQQEAIVGHVGVERVANPIAIPPGFAKQEVLIQPIGIRVARQVQPVTPESLTKSRRTEQSVDQTLSRIRGGVVYKTRYFD